jgi:hypothetical protein
MLVHARCTPIALILAVVVVVGAVVYVALNRNHLVAPEPPLQQAR